MTLGQVRTLEEALLDSFLHGMVGTELAPELRIMILRPMGSFGGVRKTYLWWLVLRHEDDIPELAAATPTFKVSLLQEPTRTS